ncbi:helix-turn-helix domain-containing protein [Paenibacillus sp. FSL H8-0034]|uniref:helix-turn-helix domain-containing protein n=1 Tax=Paenibacillus sp. FSL H8-0034 TaxID=2954671 RepID=UPI0030FCBECA
MSLRFSRYFRMILVYSLVLGTLPVIILGLYSYYKSSSIIQDKVQAANRNFLEQTQLRIEQELMSVDNVVMQYLNTSLVKNAFNQSLGVHDFQIVQELMSTQNGMKTLEFNVTNVELVHMEKDWVIDKDGLHTYQESLGRERYNQYAKVDKRSFWAPEIINGTVYISLVKKLPLVSASPHGLIVVQIPIPGLSNLDSIDDMLGKMMIMDGQFQVLAHSEPQQMNDILLNASDIERLQREEARSGYFLSSDNKNGLGVVYRRSSYNGWIYLYLVPIDEMVKDSRNIGWLTFYICLGIFVITVFLSLLSSSRIYSPVRKLYAYMADRSESKGPIRINDEFAHMAESMQRLVNSNSEMAGQIETQIRQVEDYFLMRLLQGGVGAREAEEKAQLFGYTRTGWRHLCLLAMQADRLEETTYRTEDMELLMYAANNIVSELIPESRRLFAVPLGAVQVCLFYTQDEDITDFRQQVYRDAEYIQGKIREVLKLPVSIGISRPYLQFAQTAMAYEEASEALKYRIRLDRELILNIEDVVPDSVSKPQYPLVPASELCDEIRMANLDEAASSLDQFIEELQQQALSPREYQLLFVRLLVDIMKVAENAGETLDWMVEGGKDSGIPFDRLYALKTMKEIRQWLWDSMIVPLIRRLESQRETQYTQIAEVMVDMIHEKFDTDLTLEVCSAQLNYHPNYIKRVFRKGTGINFSDYLLMHRMKTAKEWLVNTDMPIAEIAGKLRYQNSQNFIRQFRKMEGVTPGQFRKSAE